MIRVILKTHQLIKTHQLTIICKNTLVSYHLFANKICHSPVNTCYLQATYTHEKTCIFTKSWHIKIANTDCSTLKPVTCSRITNLAIEDPQQKPTCNDILWRLCLPLCSSVFVSITLRFNPFASRIKFICLFFSFKICFICVN